MIPLVFAGMMGGTPQFPAFSAKFVPCGLNTDVTIIEAKKDLSLIGFSSYRMGDGPVPQPLTILASHLCGQFGVDDSSAFWSYHIVGPRRVLAVVSTRPQFRLDGPIAYAWYEPYPAKYVVALRRGDHLITVNRIAPPKNVIGADTGIGGAAAERASGWPLDVIRRRIGENYKPNIDIETSDGTRPFAVTNFSYLGKDEFMPVIGGTPQHWFAGIEVGGTPRLLQECVVGTVRYTIDQVLWEAKSGWMIGTASHDGIYGLVWLYPLRRVKMGK